VCAPAAALEGDWSWGGGAMVAAIPTLGGAWGVGGTVHTRYGLTDTLNLNMGVLYAYHFASPVGPEGEVRALQVTIPHVGLVYALDIIEVVPYVLLDLTVYTADWPFFGDNDRSVGVGALVGLGLDYRRWREWSVGVEVAYHGFLTDIIYYPVYLNINLHASYHYDAPF
jgi:hypothetical protein